MVQLIQTVQSFLVLQLVQVVLKAQQVPHRLVRLAQEHQEVQAILSDHLALSVLQTQGFQVALQTQGFQVVLQTQGFQVVLQIQCFQSGQPHPEDLNHQNKISFSVEARKLCEHQQKHAACSSYL